jgi:hypothetical protein
VFSEDDDDDDDDGDASHTALTSGNCRMDAATGRTKLRSKPRHDVLNGRKRLLLLLFEEEECVVEENFREWTFC